MVQTKTRVFGRNCVGKETGTKRKGSARKNHLPKRWNQKAGGKRGWKLDDREGIKRGNRRKKHFLDGCGRKKRWNNAVQKERTEKVNPT